MSHVLRNLPSVNELLDSPPLKSLLRHVNQTVVTSGVRSFLERLRTDVQNASGINVPSPAELAERIARWIASGANRALHPVINATGTLLHPTLGGGPLADEAIQAIASVGANYATALGESNRSVRNASVERLIVQLCGAEAALVVSSGAAANFLSLATLASGREVIIARNELIDTGDGYRVADAIVAAGATMREVGAANRTSLDDFSAAVNDRTGAVLRVHSSSFQQLGDVISADSSELSQLARRMNVPLICELGTGALIDFNRYGIIGEPVVSEMVKAGADLVIFSGDKLIGGPACGIVVGRQTFIDRLAQNPIARAVQADKLTLAALYATLELYLSLPTAELSIPLLSMLSTPIENLKNRAERLAPQIQATSAVASASAMEDEAYLTGSSLPRHRIPTYVVAITPAEGTVEQLIGRLMSGTCAVFARSARGRLLLDLRSVRPRHDQELVTAFQLLSQRTDADTAIAPASFA
jgi:L-seryl-tRNA(Ser) seleniumtransferase